MFWTKKIEYNITKANLLYYSNKTFLKQPYYKSIKKNQESS